MLHRGFMRVATIAPPSVNIASHRPQNPSLGPAMYRGQLMHFHIGVAPGAIRFSSRGHDQCPTGFATHFTGGTTQHLSLPGDQSPRWLSRYRLASIAAVLEQKGTLDKELIHTASPRGERSSTVLAAAPRSKLGKRRTVHKPICDESFGR